MLLFSSLLFAVSANLDSLLIGISYGIRGFSIKLWQNMLITLITLLGTLFSLGTSTLLLPFLPTYIAHVFGSGILLLMGLYYIGKSLLLRNTPSNESPETAAPSTLSLCLLGVALSANNIGMGISAGFAGLSLLPTLAATLVCSAGFLFLGNRLGRCRRLKLSSNISDLLSGLLLIGLSLFTILFA
ncbi:MAG: manganese efflux pump [Roseburia sp.]|nr:manganese efflux pump [Roseburia sp.]